MPARSTAGRRDGLNVERGTFLKVLRLKTLHEERAGRARPMRRNQTRRERVTIATEFWNRFTAGNRPLSRSISRNHGRQGGWFKIAPLWIREGKSQRRGPAHHCYCEGGPRIHRKNGISADGGCCSD